MKAIPDPSARPGRWPLLLLALACASPACHSTDSGTTGSGATESTRPAMLTGEPEPAGTGFKPLKSNCAEPVVRMLQGAPSRPDAGSLEDAVRSFVVENRDFASPLVHYAFGGSESEPVLLARCPDPDTANRFVRKLHDHARDVRATPVCGYAVSGWVSARRTVELP